ncbi:hypothetical protein [Hydrogenophaga sp.]|uniref:hypothetical protein n=1 Tax=Hydrogenophaga sp. TaxID=1904254 RepID=UPI00272F9C95|nr:hypothetical protein [Hydrogenophaga sp.]MDP2015239.1 hypothetical protein [Hydrogenophaga sp.]
MKLHEVAFSIGAQLDNFTAAGVGTASKATVYKPRPAHDRLESGQVTTMDQACLDATRLAFRYRNKVTFSEILAVPVVTAAEPHPRAKELMSLSEDATDWDCVQAALDAWAPCDMALRPLRRLLDVRQLQHWGPRDTRYLLEHSLPTGPTFRHKLTQLPDSSVRALDVQLSFLMMVATSPKGWPGRFLGQSELDERLRSNLKFLLSPNLGNALVQVNLPQCTPDAFAFGVNSWVDALSFIYELKGLDFHLDAVEADRWWWKISIASCTESHMRIPLRAHLLGDYGLRRILRMDDRNIQKGLH